MGRSKNHTTNTYRIQTSKIFYPEEKRVYRCHNCKIYFRNCRSFGGHKGKCKVNVRRSSAPQSAAQSSVQSSVQKSAQPNVPRRRLGSPNLEVYIFYSTISCSSLCNFL